MSAPSFMPMLGSSSFLRRVLWVDALSGATIAVLHLAAADWLGQWLGLPPPLITGSGAVIIAFVALAGFLATREWAPRALLALLVLGNFTWALACLLLAFSGTVALTPLGLGYLLAQALAVAGLAELQWIGWRSQARQAAW